MNVNSTNTAASYMQAAQTATQQATQSTSAAQGTSGQGDQPAVRKVVRQQSSAQQVASKDIQKAGTVEEQHDSTPNDDGTGRNLNVQA